MPESRLHRTKVDPWLAVVICAGGALPVGIVGADVVYGGGVERDHLVLLAAPAVYFGLLALLAWPVHYVIGGGHLRVRAGLLLRYEIALAEITAIRPTTSPLSAPAWSLDRLRIDYSRTARPGSLVISPADKAAFLRDIVERCPGLVLDGDSLVRL
jgi:hypothetical protein